MFYKENYGTTVKLFIYSIFIVQCISFLKNLLKVQIFVFEVDSSLET